MKNEMKLLLSLLVYLSLCAVSCKKYPGDSYDFSDKTRHYMTLTPASVTFNTNVDDMDTEDDESDDVYVLTPKNITLTTRVGFVDPIAVKYTIAITGGATKNIDYTYPAFSTSKAIGTKFDVADFPAGKDVITGTITLNSATGEKYGPLVIGYPNPNTGVVINFKAYRPGSKVNP